MLSPLAFEIPAVVLGFLLGSFLNVCISRLPEHRSILKPRSHCPACGHTIRWYDNIPLLSWLLLRARCRDCRASIPWRYPLVELVTALWFGYVALRLFFALGGTLAARVYHPYPPPPLSVTVTFFVGLAALGFLLIGLFVMDWQTSTLPDAFTLTGTALGFLLVCVQAIFLPYGAGDVRLTPRSNLRMSSPGSFAAKGNVFLTGTEHLVFGRLAAVVGAALILLLVRWAYRLVRKEEGLGLGDIKLLAMIAAFLGFWPSVLTLFVGTLAAAAYAVVLLVTRRARLTTRLPFGSFLCLGGLFSAVFGERIIVWYSSLL